MDLLPPARRRPPPPRAVRSRRVALRPQNMARHHRARRLLRTDLLPLRLDGFFCLGRILHPPPCFFSRRPSAGRQVGGGLDFLDTRDAMDLQILDHCNGLLLLDFGRLVNPATRQWVRLPASPHPPSGWMISTRTTALRTILWCHHTLRGVPDPHIVPARLGFSSRFKEDSEWPPSPYTTHVFSSRSWRWEIPSSEKG